MSSIKCPNCGAAGKTEQLICSNCNTLLFNPSASTVRLRIDPALLRLRRRETLEREARQMFQSGVECILTLNIRGVQERLSFEQGTEIVLGRGLSGPSEARFDLTPYGAHERGVSREHALIRFSEAGLTIADLRTVNGTSLNSEKLQPELARELHSDDLITLGSLSFTITVQMRSELGDLPSTPSTTKLSPDSLPEAPPTDDDGTRPIDKA